MIRLSPDARLPCLSSSDAGLPGPKPTAEHLRSGADMRTRASQDGCRGPASPVLDPRPFSFRRDEVLSSHRSPGTTDQASLTADATSHGWSSWRAQAYEFYIYTWATPPNRVVGTLIPLGGRRRHPATSRIHSTS